MVCLSISSFVYSQTHKHIIYYNHVQLLFPSPDCPSNCDECDDSEGSMVCTACKDQYALDSTKTCVSKYMISLFNYNQIN